MFKAVFVLLRFTQIPFQYRVFQTSLIPVCGIENAKSFKNLIMGFLKNISTIVGKLARTLESKNSKRIIWMFGEEKNQTPIIIFFRAIKENTLTWALNTRS